MATDQASEGKVVPLRSAQRRATAAASLLDRLPAAIYTTDAEGRVTFFNRAAAELAGREPRVGQDRWCVTWRLYNPDGSPLPHDRCPMAVALKEGREVRGLEAIAERPDGSRIWFAPYPTPLRDGAGRIVGAVNMLVDITERKRAEARQALLMNEINHRANNLLGVVQATLRLTRAPSTDAFKEVLEGRIGALALAHRLLSESRWASADLQRLASGVLDSLVGGERARLWMSGASTPLDPATAQCLAMVLHELGANAATHGALLADAGEVRLDWRIEGDDLMLRWSERGGPPTPETPPTGVGLRVIRGAVDQLGGKLRFDWRSEGLGCEICVPKSRAASEFAQT